MLLLGEVRVQKHRRMGQWAVSALGLVKLSLKEYDACDEQIQGGSCGMALPWKTSQPDGGGRQRQDNL